MTAQPFLVFDHTTSNVSRLLVAPVCPDLLDYEAIGEADNLRGRVVRVFFWFMRAWPARSVTLG